MRRPSTRISITRDFNTGARLMYQTGKPRASDDDLFLQSLRRNYNVSMKELKEKFEAVSFNRADLT